MVSFRTTQWNDTWRPQFLTIGSVGCFRNVTIVVTNAWFSKLTWTIHVSVLPVVSKCIPIVLTEQSKLRCCFARRCLSRLFSNKPELFADQPELLAHKPTVLANESQLQSIVTQLLTYISKLFANISTVLSNGNLCSIKPSILANVAVLFADQPVLTDIPQLFANFSGILPDESLVFTLKSFLLSNFAVVLSNIPKLLTNIPELHPSHTVLLSNQSKLLSKLTALFPNIPKLLTFLS